MLGATSTSALLASTRLKAGIVPALVERRRTGRVPSGQGLMAHPDHASFLPSFSCSSTEQQYAIGIMGDLHLEPAQMHLFGKARDHLLASISAAKTINQANRSNDNTNGVSTSVSNGNGASNASRSIGGPSGRIVQLGDLGGYQHRPGSRDCFKVADEFLSSFGVPVGLILGNHDLEGDEFDDDAANLAAWTEMFKQRHYWAAELGEVMCVGMSTTRFRSNKYSVHEVYIDEEQLSWFEGLLQQYPERPFVIFTHAPPIGSGLKVVQNVHVKNRCAWLNHSEHPERFMQLVERYPNIRLWFSGHFHLSQNYADSVSIVGKCAFVQTGVIGECNRDGNRQSRLLRLDGKGYELYTVDHEDGGRERLDLSHEWADQGTPIPHTPEEELVCDPSAGWLCSQVDCELDTAAAMASSVVWYPAGGDCLLALQQDSSLLVEYQASTRSPVGLVTVVEDGQAISVVTADGAPSRSEDGSDVAAVLLTNTATGEVVRVERNEQGSFFRVYQHNKWRAKLAAQEAAAAASAAAAAERVLVAA